MTKTNSTIDHYEHIENLEGELRLLRGRLNVCREFVEALIRNGYFDPYFGKIEAKINPDLAYDTLDALGIFRSTRQPDAAKTTCGTPRSDVAYSGDGEAKPLVSEDQIQ